jgi:hypothetical protein
MRRPSQIRRHIAGPIRCGSSDAIHEIDEFVKGRGNWARLLLGGFSVSPFRATPAKRTADLAEGLVIITANQWFVTLRQTRLQARIGRR